MVSVRDSHFSQAGQHNPSKWAATLGLTQQDQKSLLQNYHKISHLCAEQEDLPLLQLGIEMVEILITLNMDMDTLNAALIFPFLDHNNVLTQEKLQELWGKRIAKLVKGATDMEGIRALQGQGGEKIESSQVDNLRHMLLAMVDDVRAVVIKLAERLCYMRQIRHEDESIKIAAAREISSIYAPLANRLGIGQLKWELEDLAFFYLQPVKYKNIVKLLNEKRLSREQYINDFVGTINQSLKDMKITGHAYGRPKHIYSIFGKMQKKDLQFDELFDVRAVRVVVANLQDCYGALGAIHSKYDHISSEFDDYVANPKPNGYQSIHSIVLGEGGKTIEVQIRTQQMHDDAELGVAAHWKYKEGSAGGKSANGYEEKIAWLRKILAWQEDIADSEEVVDEVRSQVFDDRVYVFTPNGQVIDLPAGATPLDFAYYIHSQVGHRCIGAKVANNIVPFTYQLKTGDQVEILTQKEANPSRDWLNPNLGYMIAPRARSKVATWFRKQDREKNVIAGREILEIELAKIKLKITDINPAIVRFNVGSNEDIFAGVGCGDLRINQLLHFIDDYYHQKTPAELDLAALEAIEKKSKNVKKKKAGNNIIIDGVDNLLYSVARCCEPIPGEAIEGYITQGRGISVHRKSCLQLADLKEAHPERLISAVWGDTHTSGYSLTLRLESIDRSGLLKDITILLSNESVNLQGVHSVSNVKSQSATIDLNIEVYNNEGISALILKLKQLKDVTEVRRL